jgi:hypothetical protein
MATVFVFAARGRFQTITAVHEFVDQTYTDDGDAVPSQFMSEIDLSGYDPMCIETVHSPRPVPLAELLRGTSFADQWLSQVDASLIADSAICAFSPNAVARPERSSLDYVGAFGYKPTGRAIPVDRP